MVGLQHYLLLSAILFSIGIFGILVRRNLLVILMCVEIMLSAANVALVAFSRFGVGHGLDGQVVVLFNFVIAACEASVGLGLIVAAFRCKETVSVDAFRLLKG